MGPLIFLAAALVAPQDELLLICEGTMIADVGGSSTTASVSGSYGQSATGQAYTTRTGQVGVSVQFRMVNGQAQINLPSAALPALNSAKEGWLNVKDLSISDTQIAGKVRLNFLNSSRFRIDRRTGVMTSDGGFQGVCQKQDVRENRF